VPPWYTDAKLGIFVHWGLYSIPAFAERTGDDYTAFMRDLTTGKDTTGRIPYAEWYLNALRVPGSATARYHQATHGSNFSYVDFRSQPDAQRVRGPPVDPGRRWRADRGAAASGQPARAGPADHRLRRRSHARASLSMAC
jgi:hypothetical protein